MIPWGWRVYFWVSKRYRDIHWTSISSSQSQRKLPNHGHTYYSLSFSYAHFPHDGLIHSSRKVSFLNIGHYSYLPWWSIIHYPYILNFSIDDCILNFHEFPNQSRQYYSEDRHTQWVAGSIWKALLKKPGVSYLERYLVTRCLGA